MLVLSRTRSLCTKLPYLGTLVSRGCRGVVHHLRVTWSCPCRRVSIHTASLRAPLGACLPLLGYACAARIALKQEKNTRTLCCLEGEEQRGGVSKRGASEPSWRASLFNPFSHVQPGKISFPGVYMFEFFSEATVLVFLPIFFCLWCCPE